MPTVADVVAKACYAAFGKPLITNVLRGQVVEAIVACALEPDWIWCASDYASWDFERSDGTRIEVKQSAAKQTWSRTNTPSIASFDIAERKGRWEAEEWIAEAGRAAHLYVFAHHEGTGPDADHRDADQWTFYVVPTSQLPDSKRLSLAGLRTLSTPCSFAGLLGEVTAKAVCL